MRFPGRLLLFFGKDTFAVRERPLSAEARRRALRCPPQRSRPRRHPGHGPGADPRAGPELHGPPKFDSYDA